MGELDKELEGVISLEEFKELGETSFARGKYDWDKVWEYLNNHFFATMKDVAEVVGCTPSRARSWLMTEVKKGTVKRFLFRGRIVFMTPAKYDELKQKGEE